MIQQPFNLFEKHLQKQKIKYLQGSCFLEVGCGDCSVFKDTPYIVDGYDISDQMFDKCSNYRRVSTNIEEFDISSYDTVCLLGVLEHMEEEDITFLKKKLVKAKNIYITVPNADSFHRGIGVRMGVISNRFELGPHDYEIGHKRYYNYSSLLVTFGDMNFSVSFSGTAGFKFDTSKNMEKYLDRIQYIEDEAERCRLIGKSNFRGAELILNLTNNG